MRHHRWLISATLLAVLGAGTAAADEDGTLEFEQVVWVQHKAPQISLLYVLVPDSAKELPEANKLVLQYASLALREAERLTGLDERKLPRFKGEFNFVFLISSAADGNQALATGFSVEQLKEYTTAPREQALRTIARHAWTHQKLPLIRESTKTGRCSRRRGHVGFLGFPATRPTAVELLRCVSQEMRA
jgi:hypothetical protein